MQISSVPVCCKSGKMQPEYNLRSDEILVFQPVLDDFTVTRIQSWFSVIASVVTP